MQYPSIKRNVSKGDIVGNFEICEKITDITELIEYLKNEKSIFWNFKVIPTAFFLAWQLRLILSTLDNGLFYKIKPIDKIK